MRCRPERSSSASRTDGRPPPSPTPSGASFPPDGRFWRRARPTSSTTKLQAFASRGRNDLLGSADFVDIIALVDGRPELVDETSTSPRDVRAFIADKMSTLLAAPRIDDGLAGAVPGDDATQRRIAAVIRPRLTALATPPE